MDPTFESMLQTLIQIPFIAAFIMFTLKMTQDYREDAKARDQHWMSFLEGEREQRKQAMDQGMEEVKQLTDSMKELSGAIADLARHIVDHDRNAEGRHETIISTIERNQT